MTDPKPAQSAGAATMAPLPYEVYRAQQYGKAQAEAAELTMDVAPAGGRYLASDGVTEVDANGQPIKAGGASDPNPRGTHASFTGDPAILSEEARKAVRAELMAELKAEAEAEAKQASAAADTAQQQAKDAQVAAKVAR